MVLNNISAIGRIAFFMENNFFGNSFTFNITKSHDDVFFDKSAVYDFLIVGAGPSGMNAALYAKRKGLSVGIVTYDIGGQLLNTQGIENYLGFKETVGATLAHDFYEQVRIYKVPVLKEVKVEEIGQHGDLFILKLDDGSVLSARSVLIATGGTSRKLKVPGEDRLKGKKLSYCAVCDAPFYKNMRVVVAGGGNSAVDAAIDLSHYAKEVTLIQRSVLRADAVLVEKMNKLPNVKVMLNTQITEIHGEDRVTGLTLADKSKGSSSFFETEGLFIEIGLDPISGFVKNLVKLNDKNEIVVNGKQETSVKGIYASGDVTDTPHKQIIIAAAEGAKAALEASDYLNRK